MFSWYCYCNLIMVPRYFWDVLEILHYYITGDDNLKIRSHELDLPRFYQPCTIFSNPTFCLLFPFVHTAEMKKTLCMSDTNMRALLKILFSLVSLWRWAFFYDVFWVCISCSLIMSQQHVISVSLSTSEHHISIFVTSSQSLINVSKAFH